jgi:hypothetical protein
MNGKPQPHAKQAAQTGISIRVDTHEVILPMEVFNKWFNEFMTSYTDALQYLNDH